MFRPSRSPRVPSRGAAQTLAGLLAVCSLVSIGCSKDAEFAAFITENDAFVAELQKRADKSPDAARKYFDEKKSSLKAKYDSIKDARGFQVKKENLAKLEASVTSSTITICSLELRAIADPNPKAGATYESICTDYTGLFGGETPPKPAPTGAKSAPTPPPNVSLAAIVGNKADGWLPKMFVGLKKGMSPSDVGKKFKGAETLDAFGFSEVKPAVDGVDHVQFYFAEDKPGAPKKLQSLKLYFHPGLKTPAFYDQLVKVTTEKYGKTKPADVEKHLITWVNSRFDSAQLTDSGDSYELDVSVPK